MSKADSLDLELDPASEGDIRAALLEGEEIDRIADRIGILDERISGGKRQDHTRADPEGWAAAHRLRSFETRKHAVQKRSANHLRLHFTPAHAEEARKPRGEESE